MLGLILLTSLEPMFINAQSIEPEVKTTSESSQTKETWNVALNAEATTSGVCNDEETGSNAVDGKNDTKWCDNSGATEKWLELDLGAVYNINQWGVQNAGIRESTMYPYWNTKDFRLQKSDDGENWEDVDVVSDNVQTIVKRYVPTFSAQYVRLFIDKGAYDNNTVRIYEFELYGVEQDQTPASPEANLDPIDYVDPLMNTLGDNGETSPAATTPLGLVSLGPDTDGNAHTGYYYEDEYMEGFSHLRFSGVGCSGAGGNILMMPGTNEFPADKSDYQQKYVKSSEDVSAGYYALELESGIDVELTVSEKVGFHRYTFPESENDGSVRIDLSNSYSGMLDANLKVENNNQISGMIKSKNVCGHGNYAMYYSIQFDHDFDSYTSWEGNSVGAESERTGSKSGVWLNFNTSDNKVVQAKVGLSTISVEQAEYERDNDIKNWNFDEQHSKTRDLWSELLNKVEIKDDNEEYKRIFYTQLYHSFLNPFNVTSSDGEFRAVKDLSLIHISEPTRRRD